jgi:hypothetical protein
MDDPPGRGGLSDRLQLGGYHAEEAGDQGSDYTSADLQQRALQRVEAPIEGIEASVDSVEAPVDCIETLVDVGGEIVESPVCPILSHVVHDAILEDNTFRRIGRGTDQNLTAR